MTAEESSHPLAANIFNQTSLPYRPYQHHLLEKSLRIYRGEFVNSRGIKERASSSILIQAPMGAGKTALGLGVAKDFQSRFPRRFKIGWMAMRRTLLEQAEAENAQWGFDVDMQYVSMYTRKFPKLDLLIIDECQHEAAASARNVVANAKPKYMLGLSATPVRTDKMALCYQKHVLDIGIHELIQQGYLSPYKHFSIPEWHPKTVADVFVRWKSHWGQSLVFFYTEAECREFLQIVTAAGIRADLVTATSDRKTQLDRFKSGETNILVNMAMLTEGYDEPSIKTVFVRDSGHWTTVQMAGRGLRLHPDHPHKQIVQSLNTGYVFAKHAKSIGSYILREDRWLSLQVNPQVENIIQHMCRKLITTEVQPLPNFFRISATKRMRNLRNEFQENMGRDSLRGLKFQSGRAK